MLVLLHLLQQSRWNKRKVEMTQALDLWKPPSYPSIISCLVLSLSLPENIAFSLNLDEEIFTFEDKDVMGSRPSSSSYFFEIAGLSPLLGLFCPIFGLSSGLLERGEREKDTLLVWLCGPLSPFRRIELLPSLFAAMLEVLKHFVAAPFCSFIFQSKNSCKNTLCDYQIQKVSNKIWLSLLLWSNW